MDPIEIIKEKFLDDKFAKRMGILLDEISNEHIKMHMKIKADMENFYNRPHGGAIYGLADVAFSLIGNNQNIISVALSCTINYHSSPQMGEILYIEGFRINQTRKIGTYRFNLFTKKNDSRTKIATMMSTLYRTGKPIRMM